MDDFSDHPVSVTEARANQSDSAQAWTPRDVLIACLRRIDSGELAPIELAIVMLHPDEENVGVELMQCCSSTMSLLGMYTNAAYSIQARHKDV